MASPSCSTVADQGAGSRIRRVLGRAGRAQAAPAAPPPAAGSRSRVRPPTGFLHDIVVEHSGAHRGSFDIKRGGLLPIVGIARYAGLAAGPKSTSTVARLQAAGAAGVLRESEAATLEEAYRLMTALRMEHQVRQLEAGTDPDDYVDPKALDALTRRYLREAFRLVASTQKGLAAGLTWER